MASTCKAEQTRIHVAEAIGGAMHEADQDKPVARADDCRSSLIPMGVTLAHMIAAATRESLRWATSTPPQNARWQPIRRKRRRVLNWR